MNERHIPYGEDPETKRLLHISEVDVKQRGLACGLVCPECSGLLVARFKRTSDRFTNHFAHHSEGNCAATSESLLHLFAKQMLLDQKRLRVPDWNLRRGELVERVASEETLYFDEVQLETGHNGFIPDVIGLIGDRMVFVEMYVTHAVDEDKWAKIQQSNVETIEIDLSRMSRVSTPSEIARVVCDDVMNKQWIHHPELLDAHQRLDERYEAWWTARAASQEERIEAAAKQRGLLNKELAQRGARESSAAYARKELSRLLGRESRIARHQEEWTDGSWLKKQVAEYHRHAYYVALFKRGVVYPADAFTTFNSCAIDCHPFIWQAFLWRDVLQKQATFTVQDASEVIGHAFRLTRDIKESAKDAWNFKDAQEFGVYGVVPSVYTYLTQLEEKGYVQRMTDEGDPTLVLFSSQWEQLEKRR